MSHNRGGRQHPRVDEAKERRILALLDGKPVFEPPPEPEWRARPDEVKLHCSNLSYDVGEDGLRELFSRCRRDHPSVISFMDTAHGRRMRVASRACGLRGQGAGDAALAMNGWEWAGRTLKIKLWGRE